MSLDVMLYRNYHVSYDLGKTFEPKIKFSPPLEDEIKHFLSSVLNRKKPITDGNYAQNIIKIIENIEKKIL